MAAGRRSSLVVALVMLVFAAAVLVTAYEYRGGSGLFPRFAGWLFVGLALMEVIMQARGLMKPAARGTDAGEEAETAAGRAGVRREVNGFLWVAGFLLLVYLVGFMAAIPAYMFAFLFLSARRTLWQSAAFAAGATVFVYILFIQLLEYRLYAGILLGA